MTDHQPQPALPPIPKVRPAGPDGMKQKPPRWDETDQSSDESFPASDPPPVNPGSD